jgi:predicted nucleotide-binding protein (sugar kinase/HSP70/actin superfamily)
VIRTNFTGGRSYFNGNRCERHYSNGARRGQPGENLFAMRLKLLFDRPLETEGPPILTFGIPRVLNLYENYPFWQALLTTCGFRVTLSGPSCATLYEKGVATVMSDNICLPAKLVHGHIVDLIDRKVDRIFFPMVVYEQPEEREALNSFNCPVITGYPDVVKSAIDPEGRYGVPIDSPVISFRDIGLLKKQLHLFLKPYGVSRKRVAEGVARGIEAKCAIQRELQSRARDLIAKAEARKNFCVVVAGRPYHVDPLINHGLPELLAGYGVDVLPESAVPMAADRNLPQSQVLTQWAYTNRILSTAQVVARNPALELLQITSFGCGLDAISVDEAREVLQSTGRTTIPAPPICHRSAAVTVRMLPKRKLIKSTL